MGWAAVVLAGAALIVLAIIWLDRVRKPVDEFTGENGDGP